jgi:hypothetical protein
VLTALTAFVLAGAGLVAARNGLHAAITADTGATGDAAAAGHVEHRLHGGVVAAIVAVVALIAAVIAVAVDWRGPATHPKPPRTGHGRLFSHAAGVGSLHPTMGHSGQNRWGNLSLASSQTSLAAGTGTAINLYNSVSITPAPGWTIFKQDQGSVGLFNSDKSVIVVAAADAADEPNINQEATASFSAFTQGAGMTNVQQDTSAQAQTIQGNNFQQLLPIAYTGNIQNNQGTEQVEGVWVILFNASTQTLGLLNATSPSDNALGAAAPDFKAMLQSME